MDLNGADTAAAASTSWSLATEELTPSGYSRTDLHQAGDEPSNRDDQLGRAIVHRHGAAASLNSNMNVLRLHNLNESRNFTCQAQNSFGLVVFNLSIVIKGK